MIGNEVIGLHAEVGHGDPGEAEVEQIDGAPTARGSEVFVTPDEIQRAHGFHDRLPVETPQRPVLATALAKHDFATQFDAPVRIPQQIGATQVIPFSFL